MLDGFDGLRHDAVIGSDDQYHDIGRLGTTGTHGGKRGVTRSIQEGDHATVGFDVVGTDVLGNTTGFASGNLGFTDVIQQRGLAVVDVTHDGHDWCARLGFGGLVTIGQYRLFQFVLTTQQYLVTHLLGDQLSGLLIDHLVDGRHGAHLHHRLDDFDTLDGHLVGQLGHSDGLADDDIAVHHGSRLVEAVLHGVGHGDLAALAFASTGVAGVTVVFAASSLFRGLDRCSRSATTGLFLPVQLVFCGLRMLVGGQMVITALFGASSFFFSPARAVLFRHQTSLFGFLGGEFFCFLQSGLFLLALQFFCFALGHLFCLLLSCASGYFGGLWSLSSL